MRRRNGGGANPPSRQKSHVHTTGEDPPLMAIIKSRGIALVTLMVLQSASASILDRYSDLLREHVFLSLYLTMLVGAGGNAGNQATVSTIADLAKGRDVGVFRALKRSLAVALALGALMSGFGALRIFLSGHPREEVLTISIALFVIVSTSVVLGTLLPFFVRRMGLNPEHAGPGIQVLMDVVGVLTTVTVASAIL